MSRSPRIRVRCTIFAVILPLALANEASAAARRNVIFICADDLNADLGCYGNRLVQSPNIDRLAARGVRFNRAYCQYPVCNASRTSFLSGRRPATTGIIDNATPPRTHLHDVVFLPQHFRMHGYRTMKVGKIFHTGDRFEDPLSWDIDVREGRQAKNPPAEQIVGRRGKHGIILNCDDAQTWDGYVARRGIEMLNESAAANQPFFLAIGFRRPHAPYIAPQHYHDLYPASAIPPLLEPHEHLAKIPKWALTYECGAERLTESERPDALGSYAASITFMDAQLGLILDAIDHRHLWDKTVVVFLSDHGYHLGEHGGLWHKMTAFEAGTRVPLIFAAPGQSSGIRSQLVELIDLYPTLCELCDLPKPDGLEGRSLVPVLRNSNEISKPAAFTVVARRGAGGGEKLDPARMGHSVRTARWRYTEWFDGTHELYDYDSDLYEYRNLANDPAHSQSVAELARLLSSLNVGSRAVPKSTAK
jgi:iduronate 2-sulfatase